jgi:hypothetical protein
MLDTHRCLSWTSSVQVQIYQWRNSAANTTEDKNNTVWQPFLLKKIIHRFISPIMLYIEYWATSELWYVNMAPWYIEFTVGILDTMTTEVGKAFVYEMNVK